MYNQKIMERFVDPQHAGLIKGADAVGSCKSEQCGDVVKLYLVIYQEKIAEARFKAFGSPITISAADILCDMLVGKTLDEALEITNKSVEDVISSGVPALKLHASVMAEEVVLDAVEDYRKKQEKLAKKK